jgi:hypothetical protein
MPLRPDIVRTVPLGGGFSARFTFSPGHELLLEVFPALPRPSSRKERRRFLGRYERARRGFLREVVAEIGESLDRDLPVCGEPDWLLPAEERAVRRKEERRKPSSKDQSEAIA